MAVVGPGVATSFEPTGTGSVRAVVPREAKRRVLRAATVELPLRANAMARVEDDTTHVSVGFALRDAVDAPIGVADGIAVYAGALAGSAVVHRVHAEGTEDFVVIETRPAREELVYDVDVSRVAGLRLVSNTLEFLDEGGAPRLRVAPPYVVDASGIRTDARIAVDGCAYDTDASGPWGRAVTRAGAPRCGVRVTWSGAQYPLIVDPSWMATGSMATNRAFHSATLLPSGKVLLAAGFAGAGAVVLASAELFEGSASFAATGSMTTARRSHTATLLASGKVLVAGGTDVTNKSIASAELFDGNAGFAPTGPMTKIRAGHSATRLPSGKVLVAGGMSAVYLSTAELFDGSASFAATGSMTTARVAHTATLLPSGKVLVAGGSYGGDLSGAELFDGNASFTATGSMTTPRSSHTATLLPSGKVLMAGSGSSAELFDGGASFAATGSMADARRGPTATLLPSGKVLVVGGDGGGGVYLSSSEAYDGTASFSATGSMAKARTGHTATLLLSGQVLVTGGMVTGNVTLETAELLGIAAGAPCAGAADCASGFCNDGVCCAGPCVGVCSTCVLATGVCALVKNAVDPDTCAVANTCDPSGACKLASGQPANDPATCASGFASDGACCDTACGAACDVCLKSLGALADGTCSTAPAGYPGEPTCGNGLACDGASLTCPSSCVSDLDCVADDYCAADGTCRPVALQGDSCNTAAGADCFEPGCRECATAQCVDGVCCDTACDTPCQACTAALKESGADNGTCGAAKAQTNPHHDPCETSPASTCGPNGLCSGAGACGLYYPPGTSCGPSVCLPGNKAVGDVCNGSGNCGTDPGGVNCNEYLCVDGSCPSQCATDADCIETAYCQTGKCIAKTSNGAACKSANQCASAFCVDGRCCNGACDSQCSACDATGTEGTCTPIVGAPHNGRPMCPSADATKPCATATCDGVTASTCTGFVGSGTSCRAASCESGLQTLRANCDGKGGCPEATTKPCASFACGSTECNTTCAADTDCASGYTCDKSTSTCVSGATCGADGHTATGASGTTTDCAPFNCDGKGSCRTACSSVDDCASPNVCDGFHHCVAPTASASGDGGDSGGCTVGAARPQHSPSRTPALIVVLGLAGLAARRRRADLVT